MHIKSSLMGSGMTADSYPASLTTASQTPPLPLRFCSSGNSCAENSVPNERLETQQRPLEVTMFMPRQAPPALTCSSSSSVSACGAAGVGWPARSVV